MAAVSPSGPQFPGVGPLKDADQLPAMFPWFHGAPPLLNMFKLSLDPTRVSSYILNMFNLWEVGHEERGKTTESG
jgi:hypothetical protein